MVNKLSNCPSCGSIKYDYAFTWGTLITESARAITDFDIKRIIVLPILRELILSTPLSFFHEVLQGIPATPALVCTKCRAFLLVCPSCHRYFQVSDLPKKGKIYRCHYCKFGFCACECTDDFNRLLGKKSSAIWLSAFIGWAVLGSVIYLIVKVLFMVKVYFMP